MNTSTRKEQPNTALTTLIIIVIVLALIGGGVFLARRSQSSDPTLTKAPPPGPNAQTLQPSAQKKMHPGPMYRLSGSGAVLNTPTSAGPGAPGYPVSIGAGGYPGVSQPGVAVRQGGYPAQGGTH